MSRWSPWARPPTAPRSRSPSEPGPAGHAGPHGPVDQRQLAVDLAANVVALQRIDATGAPTPGPGRRGGPLAGADETTRGPAERLRGEVDVDALLAVWDAGTHAPRWDRAPVWVHGDLQDGNLLVREGRLTGAIDP